MEYFYICQDKRYKNPPRIQNFYDQYYPNLFCPEHHDKIKDKNVVYANSRQPVEFIDLISGPVLLVSEAMYQVLLAYEDITFKMFFILNVFTGQGEVYYAVIMEKTDCLRTEKINGEKGLILKKEKIKEEKSLLKANKEEFRNGLIINMMVAESLLRRRLKGICYQRLEVE